jgi:hypothetical protein
MSAIPAPNYVLPVVSALTASPGAVHEGHTMMTLHPEVLRCDADVQPRRALSDAHIRAYAALLQEGHQLGTISWSFRTAGTPISPMAFTAWQRPRA